MASSEVPLTAHRGQNTRLAPRIAWVLLVKILGLVLIWFAFVRDQRVAVDARSTAAAFGLSGGAQVPKLDSAGATHGQ